MTPEEKSIRAVEAQQLLDNKYLKESFVIIRATIIESMNKVKPNNTKEIQEQVRTLQNLNRLEKTIQSIVSKGKVAEKNQSLLDKFMR